MLRLELLDEKQPHEVGAPVAGSPSLVAARPGQKPSGDVVPDRPDVWTVRDLVARLAVGDYGQQPIGLVHEVVDRHSLAGLNLLKHVAQLVHAFIIVYSVNTVNSKAGRRDPGPGASGAAVAWPDSSS